MVLGEGNITEDQAQRLKDTRRAARYLSKSKGMSKPEAERAAAKDTYDQMKNRILQKLIFPHYYKEKE